MSVSVQPFFRSYPVAAAIAVAAAYFFSARLGLSLAFDHPSATAVWPPTGIALATLVLGGNRFWPAIFLAAFAANAATAGSWATSLGIAAGNTLEALIGATLAVRFAGGAEAFDRSANIVRWTLYCAGLASAVSATVGVSSLCLGGFAAWPDFRWIWLTWWLGDAGSALVVAPLLILWGRDARVRLDAGRVAELVLMSLAFLALGSLVFGKPVQLAAGTFPIPFAFPFLAWVAFRLGPRGTALALAALEAVAAWGTLSGRGPFVGRDPHESLLLLEIFMAATAATALAVAAVVEQRRRAETGFRRGEERRRLILESALDAVVIMDGAGRISDWSPRAEQLFGWSREEAVGKRLTETLLPPDHRLAREWAADGDPGSGAWRELNRRFEFDARRKDGGLLPVEISVTASRGENGAVYSAFARDVGERRRAENARARLAAVVENSDDAIVTKSLDGVIATWNRGAERLFGYAEAEILGKPVTTIIPEELHAEEEAILGRLRRGERIAQIETRRRAKDGRLLDVSLSISPIRDDSGAVVGASTIARDITTRKRAEAAERHLFDAGRALTASIDLERTLERVARLSPGTLAEGCIVDVALDPDGPRLRAAHHRDPARTPGADALPESERVFRTGEAELRPGRLVLPLRAGGRFLGTLAFLSDDPERVYGPEDLALGEALARQAALAIENSRLHRAKEDFNRSLEAQVQQRTAELKNALAELESFSYTVAHDLRAPLRSLASFSELLKSDYAPKLDEAGREYVDRIANAALRMDALVQDLLAYSRVAREEVRLESVELGPLLDEVLVQLEPEIRPRGARVRVDGPLPTVAAHRLMLIQSLSNLLGNALKFVPEGTTPEVVVDAEDRGDAVRIRVRDNGIGIPPGYHEKIFEIFERLEPGRFPGTGVGLAIVRKALDRMGGFSGVESEPGKGSRFWIELRKASAAPSA